MIKLLPSFLQNLRFKKWNLLLLVSAVAIILFFVFFTNYLVDLLSYEERYKVERLAAAYEAINNPSDNLTEELKVIQADTTTKIIITDDKAKIRYVKNYPESVLNDSIYLYSQLKIIKILTEPIHIKITEGVFWSVYYKEKTSITLLRFYPYLQMALIAGFLLLSYMAFNTSRRYQQNKVWVGMAKETAHQIGTPLSSLMAWIEYMRVSEEVPSEETLDEMQKDIERLEVITERFSKIGSVPELSKYNVYDTVEESIKYLSKRISKKVFIVIDEKSIKDAEFMINKNLFGWVIENLTKNAVDAMTGAGSITFFIDRFRDDIIIDVTDTGKGIAKNRFKTIFNPGFTTKKRGWGLGLSLTKRIIEEYHHGKIIVKESELGVGTTFRIILAEKKNPETFIRG